MVGKNFQIYVDCITEKCICKSKNESKFFYPPPKKKNESRHFYSYTPRPNSPSGSYHQPPPCSPLLSNPPPPATHPQATPPHPTLPTLKQREIVHTPQAAFFLKIYPGH